MQISDGRSVINLAERMQAKRAEEMWEQRAALRDFMFNYVPIEPFKKELPSADTFIQTSFPKNSLVAANKNTSPNRFFKPFAMLQELLR